MENKNPLNSLNLPQGMIERLYRGANMISSYSGTLRLITHYDGDGLASAGILSKVFMREGLSFHLSVSKNAIPDPEHFIKGNSSKLFVLADLGSSLIKELKKEHQSNGKEFIILDHHYIQEEVASINKDDDGILMINPRLYGIDGTRESSGSILSFLLSLALRESNMDLGIFALAGAFADKQMLPKARGINLKIAKMLQEKGFIEIDYGVKFPGESLEKSLFLSVEPYFPGISGRSPAVRRFLKDLGISGDWNWDEIPQDKKTALHSALYLYLLKNGIKHYVAKSMFKEIYKAIFNDTEVNIEDIGYEINAAGRMGEYPVGVRYVFGDAQSIRKAKELRGKYREEVLSQMLKLEEVGVRVMQNIQYIEVNRDEYGGTLAGLGMQYLFDPEKPTIAITRVDNKIKISARGTWYLIDKGLDLADALKRAAEAVGGSGGGHNIAAGATIEESKEELFLRNLDKIIGGQLNERERRRP